MKKRISFLCASLILMHVFLLSVFAVDFQTVSQVSDEERNAYIADVLPRYLTLDDNELPKDAVVLISDPIQVINNPDNQSRVYLIMVDNHYYAKLGVTYSDGKYYSSFMFDKNDKIDLLHQTQTPFALAAIDNQLVIVTDDGCELFYNTLPTTHILNNSHSSILNVKLNNYCWKEIDICVENDVQSQRFINDYSVSLSVPFIENTTSNANRGLCWAASIAAIAKFHTNVDYTPLQIYHALDNNPNYSGTPVGDHEWILRGFQHCNVSVVARYGFSDIMDYFTVLDSEKPIYFSLRSSTAGASSHAVVLRSFEGGNESIMLGYMDPNTPSTVYVEMEYDYYGEIDMSEFTYHQDTYTYNGINRIYYKN